MERLVYKDYVDACEAALFQLAEVAGWGEMYTREDVDRAEEEAYNRGYDEGYSDGEFESAPE
jgi:hypothetical protein